MAKNFLRKGSKVFVSIGLKGKKTTLGIVEIAKKRDIVVRILSGKNSGKLMVFLPSEIKRR